MVDNGRFTNLDNGRFTNLPRHNRTCHICNNNCLGDEFHFIFECSDNRLVHLRNRYISDVYCINHNILKFNGLMNCKNTNVIIGLAKYIKEGMKIFK